MRGTIEAAGATLMFLLPYSPDFNPIEKAFSRLNIASSDKRQRAAGKPSTLWHTRNVAVRSSTSLQLPQQHDSLTGQPIARAGAGPIFAAKVRPRCLRPEHIKIPRSLQPGHEPGSSNRSNSSKEGNSP